MPEEVKDLGCLGIGESDKDYVLCEGDGELIPDLYQQDEIRYEYNQGNQGWSRVSCTIFAAVGMLSDLMNYEFSLNEIKEIDNLSYNNPKYHIRKKGEGWYVKDAVDLVANRWNTNHGDKGKVAYYRINKYSDIVDTALQKGYTLETNFCPTVDYARDYYLEDAVLDGYEFGTKTNGHAVDVIWDNHRAIKDSYKGRKTADGKKDCNIYELKHPIAKITNYGAYLYIYTKVAEDNMQEIKRLNEIKAECNTIIDHLGALWHMVNDEKFRNTLHNTAEECRNKIKTCNELLIKFS